eukprot:COSAG05_NODE_9_length_39734_cov_180.598067_29_plen_503_part_00
MSSRSAPRGPSPRSAPSRGLPPRPTAKARVKAQRAPGGVSAGRRGERGAGEVSNDKCLQIISGPSSPLPRSEEYSYHYELGEEVVVSFTEPGPLGLVLAQQRIGQGEWIVVIEEVKLNSQAAANNRLRRGLVVMEMCDQVVRGLSVDEVLQVLQQHKSQKPARPVMARFCWTVYSEKLAALDQRNSETAATAKQFLLERAPFALAKDAWRSSAKCEACNKEYNMATLGEHHCRLCGGSFCTYCAPNKSYRVLDGKTGRPQMVRACNSCREGRTGELLSSPDYRRIPDAAVVKWAAVKCAVCSKTFGLSTRKHHCRLCGEVVCSTCAPTGNWEVVHPHDGSTSRVRACAPCITKHGQEQSARQLKQEQKQHEAQTELPRLAEEEPVLEPEPETQDAASPTAAEMVARMRATKKAGRAGRPNLRARQAVATPLELVPSPWIRSRNCASQKLIVTRTVIYHTIIHSLWMLMVYAGTSKRCVERRLRWLGRRLHCSCGGRCDGGGE